MSNTIAQDLATYLAIAWLTPLLSFVIAIFNGFKWGRTSRNAAFAATAAIATGFVSSAIAMNRWICEIGGWDKLLHPDHHEHHAYAGVFYDLATFGSLKLSISYYIDSLTLTMFCMVTFIATCIHIFAMGYMSEELAETYDDHQAHVTRGVNCATCHGPIETMARVTQYSDLSMGWCINCHRQPENKAPLNCSTCHH